MAIKLEDMLPGVKYQGLNTDKDVSISGSTTLSGATTISGALTTTGVLTPSTIVEPNETVAATETLVAADSGKTIFLSSATEFATTLPAPAAGLKFRFIVAAAPSGASYTVVTNGGDNVIEGSATVNGAAVAAVNEDTITFTDGAAAVGDWVEVVSDGTSWYVSGQGVAATAIAFTAT